MLLPQNTPTSKNVLSKLGKYRTVETCPTKSTFTKAQLIEFQEKEREGQKMSFSFDISRHPNQKSWNQIWVFHHCAHGRHSQDGTLYISWPSLILFCHLPFTYGRKINTLRVNQLLFTLCVFSSFLHNPNGSNAFDLLYNFDHDDYDDCTHYDHYDHDPPGPESTGPTLFGSANSCLHFTRCHSIAFQMRKHL